MAAWDGLGTEPGARRAGLPGTTDGAAGVAGPPDQGPGAPAVSAADALPAPPALPTVALPSGGGALRAIGEKFTANPATGTGSYSIPVPLSAARAGFSPQLTLSYDSGREGGPFGLGWHLDVASVTRRTDRGVPLYLDDGPPRPVDGTVPAPGEVADTFLLAGGEELVPDGRWRTRGEHRVLRYAPRVESEHTRVERWVHISSGETHWRTTTRENVTTLFGSDPLSRVADPRDPSRVLTWLASEAFDSLGNAIRYEYRAEDEAGVDTGALHERGRCTADRTAARHLARVRYGNTVPWPTRGDPGWLFEVLLDYGDLDDDGDAVRSWDCRPDPFSTYRGGFEVRTYRLCRRLLLRHAVPGGYTGVTRELELRHELQDGLSVLAGAVAVGRRGTVRRAMPPLKLAYTRAVPGDAVEVVGDAAGGGPPPLPAPLAGYRFTDLDGDGLPGILVDDGGEWSYAANLGGGAFGPARPLRRRPSAVDLSDGSTNLVDLDGDGRLELASLHDATAGYSEREGDGWSTWRPLRHRPVLDWEDPALRLTDLTGDGHADILLPTRAAGRAELTYLASLGAAGFDAPRRTSGEPPVVAADDRQAVRTADMSGDGLPDLVEVSAEGVRYWPSLGHGRFGAPVHLLDERLDEPDLFDPRRVRLVDVDGSGPTDLVYLHRDGVRLYANRSGNRLDRSRELAVRFPRVDDAVSVDVVDLLGDGTACLVWSSPLPADARTPLRYLPLLTGGKPYLLREVRTGLGGRTTVEYEPSTAFALADRAAGRPWTTRLPFVVHLVAAVRDEDLVTAATFTTRFAYHEGHYDGVEREFGGFGLVERWDTDEVPALGPGVLPPVRTRTWFHTGIVAGGEPGAGPLAHPDARRYHRGSAGCHAADLAGRPLEVLHRGPDGGLRPLAADPATLRQAARALRGRVLREEVYAEDASARQELPYSVSTHRHAVEVRRSDGGPGALLVCAARRLHSRDEHLERDPGDPRVTDDVALDIDPYGVVRRSVAVAYGRRLRDPDPVLTEDDHAVQASTRVLLTEYDVTAVLDEPDAWRTPVPWRTTVLEVHGLSDLRPADAESLRAAVDAVTAPVPAAQWDAAGPGRRVVERAESRFRADDGPEVLPFGVLGRRALPATTRRESYPEGLAGALHGARLSGSDLDEALRAAGHVRDGGSWWAPSDEVRYAGPEGFFLPVATVGPLGGTTTVEYDVHHLLPITTTDAVGNVTLSENDYRVLRPHAVTDANGNRSEVLHDALGRLSATALVGKPSGRDATGDTVEGLDPDPADEVLVAFRADPHGRAHDLLGRATSRVLHDAAGWWRDGRPVSLATLSRDTHVRDVADGGRPGVLVEVDHIDGLGRTLQSKVATEPGPDGAARWVGTGWTVYTNKGLPLRRYEPFFSSTHEVELHAQHGVSDVVFHDPLGRILATLRPDGTYVKSVLRPWRAESWDAGDTVALDPGSDPDVGSVVRPYLDAQAAAGKPWVRWADARRAGSEAERAAAEQSAVHAGTPVVAWSDALGRSVVTVAHLRAPDGTEERLRTAVRTDARGRTREVVDPLGRVVQRLAYDGLATVVVREGVDSDSGSVLRDVLGGPVLSWTARGHRFRTEYDMLHRPVRTWVAGPDGVDTLREETEYGEGARRARRRNLRGRVHRRRDAAGTVRTTRYDTSGRVLTATRRLVAGHREEPDWSGAVDLEPARYRGENRLDALGRPVRVVAADGSVQTFGYDGGGRLTRVTVLTDGRRTEVLRAVGYDARGQRLSETLGNGVVTTFEYDPLSFRLVRACSRRGGRRLQDLRYVHDPLGNPTAVDDDARPRTFFRGRVVPAGGRYAYDSLSRLVRATGREHAGQARRRRSGRGPRPLATQRTDGAAMVRYTEHYDYDGAGNLRTVRHRVSDPASPGWTRHYAYEAASRLEPGRLGNRLTGTTDRGGRPDGAYAYDEQGNATALPGVPALVWDAEDRLRRTARGRHGAATWSTWDAAGQRARVVRTGADGAVRSERVHLGPLVVERRFRGGDEAAVTRTELSVLAEDRLLAVVQRRTAGHDRGVEHVVRHQLADGLGSVTLEVDEDARILSREEFHPYGSTAVLALRERWLAPKRYRYTGRERDPDTGMQLHGARWYLPWLGRWASPDPSGTVDGPSPYTYVSGNPMAHTDVSGHEGEGRQLNFAEQFRQEVMATRAGRGIGSALRRDLRAMWDWWGGQGAIDAGHVGKPQVFLRAGETGVVAAQPAAENRALAALERAAAADARAAGEFARNTAGIDESVAAGSRFGRVARAAWRDSDSFRQWLKTYAARVKSGAAAAESAAGAAVAETSAVVDATRQLELPFAEAAGAAAKVEQTVAAAAPALAETASAAAPALAETASAAAPALAETAAVAEGAGTLSRAAGAVGAVLRPVAPVLRVVAKVAAPIAVVASVAEAATAETQSERAHAGVNLTASVAALSTNPVTGIAAGGLAAGGFVGGHVEPLVTEATGSRTVGVGAGTLAGAATGAAIGAAVGTIVPGVGTAIGAGVGAAAGAIGGFVTSYWN